MTAPYLPGLAGALSRAGRQMDGHIANSMQDHHRQIVQSVIGKQLANSLYAAPADAVVGSNPNAKATPGTPMTGIPGALVKSAVAPVMNHPLTTLLAALAAPAVAGAGAASIPSAMAAGGALAGAPAAENAIEDATDEGTAAAANAPYRELFKSLQGPSLPSNYVEARGESPLSPEYSRIISNILRSQTADAARARALTLAP